MTIRVLKGLPQIDCLRCEGTGIPLDNEEATCGCLTTLTPEELALPPSSPVADTDGRCWLHRPSRGHARRCIREAGHEGEHIDAERQYWTTGTTDDSASAPAGANTETKS